MANVEGSDTLIESLCNHTSGCKVPTFVHCIVCSDACCFKHRQAVDPTFPLAYTCLDCIEAERKQTDKQPIAHKVNLVTLIAGDDPRPGKKG